MQVRLQKLLAEAGVASRRACEAIILERRVTVNGAIVHQLGTKVDPAADRVELDGRPVRPRRKLYVALNKPPGVLCSRIQPGEAPLVAELLPKEWHDLYPVGRLDKDSEGLLFLTNDGEFCLRLTHPRYGVRKRYLVTLEGRVAPATIERFVAGLWHGGERLQAKAARVLEPGAVQTLVEVELAEGKNREVRRLCESQGLRVLRLQRVQIGRIRLGELPVGRWRTLTPAEVRTFAPSPAPEAAGPPGSPPPHEPRGSTRPPRGPAPRPSHPSRPSRGSAPAGSRRDPAPRRAGTIDNPLDSASTAKH